VSLIEARVKARALRKIAREGGDPLNALGQSPGGLKGPGDRNREAEVGRGPSPAADLNQASRSVEKARGER
jgi:hypothetical protein